MAENSQAKLTSEVVELNWYKNHYRGDMRQLTLRAVIMGAFLGAIMSLSNIYIGLKTGWGFGVAITACILSFAIWKTMRKLGIARSDMTVLENNAMQSTASSAGYSTGGTLVSAVAAFLMVTGHHIPYGLLTLWIFFLAVLGVTMAIPMKRQLINVERLRFPSGMAAGMTLRTLHSDYAHKAALEKPVSDMTPEEIELELSGQTLEEDAEEFEDAITDVEQASKSAKGLFWAGGIGAFVAFLRDGFATLAEIGVMKNPFHIIQGVYPIFGRRALEYTIGLEGSVLMLGAGALMGIRVATSILIGAILNWAIFVPWMYNIGVIEALNYRTMVSWSLWGGAACMVTSGLLAFGLQWKSIVRALSGLGSIFKGNRAQDDDELASYVRRVEIPGWWTATGFAAGGIGIIIVAKIGFGMPVWMSALAIVLSFFLAVVACRTTGETDTSPIGAMGKVMQLIYGAIAPGKTNINLLAANITAGVADSSSALLIDLKSGYLLGAQPRKQFLAQFYGIFIGTAVTVPAFYLLVPNAEALGTDQWPAPAAVVWAGVARLLASGLETLHPTARIALLIGGVVGIMLVLLQRWLPQKARVWVPSPLGLGLAFTFHFWYAFSMFLGGLIAWLIANRRPLVDKTYTIPVASGLIAGESIMGVFLILLPILVTVLGG